MGRGKSVLVVDDDPAVRDIVATALEVDGYRVDCAANGREALDRADERAPHAVVFDVTMPVRGGWEFLARWQARPVEQRAPVLVVLGPGHLQHGPEHPGSGRRARRLDRRGVPRRRPAVSVQGPRRACAGHRLDCAGRDAVTPPAAPGGPAAEPARLRSAQVSATQRNPN